MHWTDKNVSADISLKVSRESVLYVDIDIDALCSALESFV